MIEWEEKHKQILSVKCLQCPDPYFAPYSEDLPHVGCCSYSPVFSLYEVYNMVKEDPQFFSDHIYNHPNSVIHPYFITVQAKVSNRFLERDLGHLSKLEEEDLRLQFSVCQFFVANKGCGLNPRFKNATCRSFICSSIENQMNESQKEDLKKWVTEIREEVEMFVLKHRQALTDKGLNLKDNLEEVVQYFSSL